MLDRFLKCDVGLVEWPVLSPSLIEIVIPSESYLPEYVAALRRGWSAENTGQAYLRNDRGTDPGVYLASWQVVAGCPITDELPDWLAAHSAAVGDC